MNEAKQHLRTADGLLSNISASGDNLMLLAVARQEIKAAFDKLDDSEAVDNG